MLEEANAIQFDFVISLKEEQAAKKQVHIYKEDKITLGSTKTSDYFKPKEDKAMKLSLVESAWESQKSLA